MRSGKIRFGRLGQSLVRATLAAAIAACLPTYTAMAQPTQASDAASDFNIPAGDLAGALDRFSTQTGIQFVYQPELVAGKQSRALSGRLTWREALETLLQGSGLEYGQVNDRTIVIRRSEERAAPAVRPAAASQAVPAAEEEAALTEIERMTVTGTRIRGGETPSPVITIGAENIREEGFTDLGEVIRSLPQNFNGGQNPGVVTATSSGNLLNQNGSGGSSLNLRGIGADATLTLLNGRRLAYGGFAQQVDISAIPVEAVDRIEIVTDGASAIYGSDAVAGVGNVILKRDFDGVALGVRYGAATDGGLATREFNATGGTTWTSGGLMATYKYVSADSISVEQRDYTEHMYMPFVLYPESRLRSGLLTAYQSLGDVVELRLDAFRTERDMVDYQNHISFYYDQKASTTTSYMAPSAEFLLPNDWSIIFGGAWSKDENIGRVWMVTTDTGESLYLGRVCHCNDSRTHEVNVEGPLFALGGGDARLAIGAGHRENRYENNAVQEVREESSRFAYAELNLPLVGPESNVSGVRQFMLTAALRGEDYERAGSVTTPKLGLIYGPSRDFTLRASWGRSFKAPMLYELYQSRDTVLWPAGMVGGAGYPDDATVLMSFGGNPDLDPERSRSMTATLAFHPEALPGLDVELTWFDIDYTDRVIRPLSLYWEILSNPVLAEFVVYSPTPEQQAEILANYSDDFWDYTGVGYDPDRVVAVAYGQTTNAMRQRISGIDLSGSYRFDVRNGRLTIRGSASWLDSSQQNSSAQAPYDLAGTIFYPSKVNARLGAVWTRDRFTASAFANYVAGVTNRVTGEKTASFTTFDSVLRYALGAEGGAGSGLEFAFSAQNLLNRAPPAYAPASIADVPYDSTNYSAIGRFLSVSIAKRW